MSQRVLVVDDDKQIVRLVRTYLEDAGFSVLEAYDGEAALHLIRRERPDLVVLDLMLPERDGRDVTRVVRADPQMSGLPIIMLTARVEDTDKIVGLELGADDYLTKPFNPSEVVARVRAVLRRSSGSVPPAKVLSVGDLSLDLERHQVRLADLPIELTPTEFHLLHLLMQHPGRAFTRLELIEAVGDYAYDGMERTVDSHVKNLRKKIEANPRKPELVQTVYGVGYRLRAEK